MAPDRPVQIGPYRIVEVLGEGGMGVVYLAEQTEPIRRLVALKILKVGADSESVLARFEAERRALAVMEHPGIAKIFDAGVTDDGRSYFAMEHVAGSPIGDFCNEQRLTLRQRVGLFIEVCRAVQHAHQKGVIHRDLKPSNVLVSEVDGRPLPRIIDFGIAKATEAGEFDGTQLTRDDQVIGTPAYMSPEQIDGSRDIDTRTDVYALGVLLYEILLGALPYDAEKYRGWAAVAAQLQAEPPTPARRFDELSDTQESIARLRRTTPTQLRRELGGDLGWITSRAMDRDRERRYETANGMALDLTRFLGHEPIRARGATTAYLVRKFVRRNRLGVAFGTTVLLGLAGFSIVTSVQVDRIARARDEADTRRDQAEDLIDFMLGDLRAKLEPLGRLEILDDVGDRALQYFSQLPAELYSDEELASRSKALYQIGQVRLSQGRTEESEPAFRESLRLAQELSDRSPDDDQRLFDLGQSQFWVGSLAFRRGRWDAAQAAFEGYRDTSVALAERDSTNLTWQLELSYSHTNLGIVYGEQGLPDQALQELDASLRAKLRVLRATPDDRARRYDVSQGHYNLAIALEESGDLIAARDHLLEDERLKEGIVQEDPLSTRWPARLMVSRGRLARIVGALGDSAEALRLMQAQWLSAEKLIAHDSENTTWRGNGAVARAKLGLHLSQAGHPAEGLRHLNGAIRDLAELARLDPTNPSLTVRLGSALVLRARARLAGGAIDPAREDVNRMVPMLRDAPNSSADDAPDSRLVLAEGLTLSGDLHAASGNRQAAEVEWTEALSVLAPASGTPTDWREARALATALMRLGRADEARPLVDRLSSQGVQLTLEEGPPSTN